VSALVRGHATLFQASCFGRWCWARASGLTRTVFVDRIWVQRPFLGSFALGLCIWDVQRCSRVVVGVVFDCRTQSQVQSYGRCGPGRPELAQSSWPASVAMLTAAFVFRDGISTSAASDSCFQHVAEISRIIYQRMVWPSSCSRTCVHHVLANMIFSVQLLWSHPKACSSIVREARNADSKHILNPKCNLRIGLKSETPFPKQSQIRNSISETVSIPKHHIRNSLKSETPFPKQSQIRNTISETSPNPRRALSEPRRALSEPRRALSEPRRALSRIGLVSERAFRIWVCFGKSVSDLGLFRKQRFGFGSVSETAFRIWVRFGNRVSDSCVCSGNRGSDSCFCSSGSVSEFWLVCYKFVESSFVCTEGALRA
jgi:hypothetical protein